MHSPHRPYNDNFEKWFRRAGYFATVSILVWAITNLLTHGDSPWIRTTGMVLFPLNIIILIAILVRRWRAVARRKVAT